MNPVIKKTLLGQVHGAVGSKQYQQLWVQQRKRLINVVQNGEHSCAYFISSVLHNLQLIAAPRATVVNLVKEMQAAGWYEIKTPKAGALVVWAVQDGHKHIGVYVGKEMCISNSTSKKVPAMHDWKFRTKKNPHGRNIEHILWHSLLDA